MMTSPLLHLMAWAGLVCWVLGQTWFAEVFDRPVCARQARRALAGRPAPPAPMPQVAMVSGFAVFLGPLPLALFGPALPIGLHALNILAGGWGLVLTVLLLRRREPEFARWQRYSRGRALATAVHAVLALIMVRLALTS